MLKELIITAENLSGNELPAIVSPPDVLGYFKEWHSFDLREKWLTLYAFARLVRTENHYKDYWQLLLSGLVFPNEKFPLEHLLLLHAVAVHSEEFPDLPPYSSFQTPNEDAPPGICYCRRLSKARRATRKLYIEEKYRSKER